MSAQLEEVILRADLIQLEHLSPNTGNHFFGWRARTQEFSRQFGSCVIRCRQVLAVDFAIRG